MWVFSVSVVFHLHVRDFLDLLACEGEFTAGPATRQLRPSNLPGTPAAIIGAVCACRACRGIRLQAWQCTSALCHVHTLIPISLWRLGAGLPPEPPFGHFAWLTVLPLLLQLPFRTMAMLQSAMVAINLAALLPAICATQDPTAPLAGCLARSAAKAVFRNLLLPLLVVYTVEVKARQIFLPQAPIAVAPRGEATALPLAADVPMRPAQGVRQRGSSAVQQ